MCVYVWPGTNAKRQSIRCKFNSAIALNNDDEGRGIKIKMRSRESKKLKIFRQGQTKSRLNVENTLDSDEQHPRKGEIIP